MSQHQFERKKLSNQSWYFLNKMFWVKNNDCASVANYTLTWSPLPAQLNFFLFLKLKIHLKRFEDIEDIKRNMVQPHMISKDQFVEVLQSMEVCWIPRRLFLKKINVSFIVHFSLDRYRFSLDIFWMHLV